MASIAPKRMTVVEPAPSHDNRHTFAAYSVLEGTQPAEYIAQSPPYGLIYDVTPGANPSRAEKIARAIFERTQNYRRGRGNEPNRSRLSFSRSLRRRQGLRRRIASAPRVASATTRRKDAAVAKLWFLPELLCDEWHAWGILVISCVTERWEEGLNWLGNHPEEKEITTPMEKARNARFGICLLVKWQPREATWRAYEEHITPKSRIHVSAYSLENLRPGA
ncbi:hypothetical protein N8I77_008363 [Diaporthe amygdali]|uniref:Uncharacterized protein n=1 Tax=Phomopsis amygdali TaxID=1214568 RepID=A0AAD9SFA9_PHOAM|nr:hypothetical protein N8I77_008363 [Diaporthe amygdali]